ncbi:MAG: SAM-dependent chlorinase/fluorinase [Alphaproteobacteria bacterium]
MKTTHKTAAPMAKGTVGPLHGAYQNVVILTDAHSTLNSAQIEMRFRNVLQWVHDERAKRSLMPKDIQLSPLNSKPALPQVVHITDIPSGNVDYAAYAMYCAYRALGRSRPNIFIHMVDAADIPAHTVPDRSMFVTDYGNVFLGPNNGSLGLIRKYFEERDGVESALFALDRDRIEELEQHRMEEPEYSIPATFQGRDVLAVAAGLLAGGLTPMQVGKLVKAGQPMQLPFVQHMVNLPQQLNKPLEAMAFCDPALGNLKTSLTLDALSFDQLVDDNAVFRLRVKGQKKGLFGKADVVLDIKPRRVFADAAQNELLMYLGSTFAPEWDQRMVSLAVRGGNAMARLGVTNPRVPLTLSIERLR